MNEDRALLDQLKGMWEATDPSPADLAERVLFTLQLEDLEVELMKLTDMPVLAGARGAEATTTITFNSPTLTVMLTVSGDRIDDDGQQLRRVDGWIAPAAALRVELRSASGSQRTTADADGRFSLDAVPGGLAQLRIEPTDGAAVALGRPVVTPAVQL
ncbi:hypothetical protein [Pilimelia columellifera]|uniref:Carboxypeptidase regulatory-like domain-containing protein n=1 Tax=Pilimelia columellifera subsp. columellifera TaxID=706583 RepID=A0ABN3N516_9ACTN